jgi:transcriptional antiterminator RfaH
MPLLSRETDLFPGDLFRLSITTSPWWVAHTRSRAEKALARYLVSSGTPFYLPLGDRHTRRSGRTFVSHNPFFPGYVFFRGGAEVRLRVVRSNLTVAVLDVSDQGQLDEELRQLREIQESGVSLVPCAYVGPGDGVRITEGPFRGYLGVVAREKGFRRLVVSVSILRRSVAIELERDALAPTPGGVTTAVVSRCSVPPVKRHQFPTPLRH